MANNKLREALTKILHLTNSLDENCGVDPVEIRDIARAALAEPVRNYEIGTAEEQMKRQYDTMCNTTKACPDPDWSCKECFAKWAQMPYVEKEGGAE